MSKTVIVAAARTPIGEFGGALKDLQANQLASVVLQEVVKRAGINPELVEEVILGNAIQRTDEPNTARVAALRAGFPNKTTAYTVQRQCASGLQAVVSACQAIAAGDAQVVIAGGTESMSSAPYVLKDARWGKRLMHGQMTDAMWELLTDPDLKVMMGETAERLADKYAITREEQDEIAESSHQKAVLAWETGRFSEEVVPVAVPQRKGSPVLVEKDEHPRKDISFEKLAKLTPAFRPEGTVTAGNSSSINDGAAALVLMSAEKAAALGLIPMARVVSYAVAGVEPELMGYGPVPATQKALQKAGLTLADIGLIEVNEAFAAQYLACEKLLGLNRDIVNVNGSGVGLGHPVGCTGARILTTLLYEMKRRDVKRGLATLCIGGGMGMSIVVER